MCFSFCLTKEKAEPTPADGAATSSPHDPRISSAADSIAHPWSVYNSYAYKGNAQYSHASSAFIVLSSFYHPSIYPLRVGLRGNRATQRNTLNVQKPRNISTFQHLIKPGKTAATKFESRHSDQVKVLDFTTKSSAFSFVFYPESLVILHVRVHFFKKAGTHSLRCTQKGAVKMSTITEKNKN